MDVEGPLPLGTLLRIVDEGLGAGYFGKEYSHIGYLQNGSLKLQGEGGQRVTCPPPTNVRSSRA